jgi:hypothetical protein
MRWCCAGNGVPALLRDEAPEQLYAKNAAISLTQGEIKRLESLVRKGGGFPRLKSIDLRSDRASIATADGKLRASPRNKIGGRKFGRRMLCIVVERVVG